MSIPVVVMRGRRSLAPPEKQRAAVRLNGKRQWVLGTIKARTSANAILQTRTLKRETFSYRWMLTTRRGCSQARLWCLDPSLRACTNLQAALARDPCLPTHRRGNLSPPSKLRYIKNIPQPSHPTTTSPSLLVPQWAARKKSANSPKQSV